MSSIISSSSNKRKIKTLTKYPSLFSFIEEFIFVEEGGKRCGKSTYHGRRSCYYSPTYEMKQKKRNGTPFFLSVFLSWSSYSFFHFLYMNTVYVHICYACVSSILFLFYFFFFMFWINIQSGWSIQRWKFFCFVDAHARFFSI